MLDRIDCEKVSFRVDAAPPVLREVTLTVRRGEIVIISGRSGSGKSLLLELCAGLVVPTSGRVLWDGKEIAALSKAELFRARQSMGYMFQVHALISNFTVIDNLALPLRNRDGFDGGAIMKRVRAEMENLMLSPGIDYRFPEALSSYERRAAALARALINDPAMLILDEPLAGLEPAAAEKFCGVIERRWQERAMAVVMVSHDFPVLRHFPARRMVIEEGTLLPFQGVFSSGK
jgi:ABC-type transporter Mla maintaining outer membrane lipid asymmetry ATPase subunit MlaF